MRAPADIVFTRVQALASCTSIIEYLEALPASATHAAELRYMLESLNVRTDTVRTRHAAGLLQALFGDHIQLSQAGQQARARCTHIPSVTDTQDAHEFLQFLIDIVAEQAGRAVLDHVPRGLRSLESSAPV